MKKRVRYLNALIMILIALVSWSGATSEETGKIASSLYETYLTEGTAPFLKDYYHGRLEIGIPAEAAFDSGNQEDRRIQDHFGLMICEGPARGKILLDRGSSKKRKDPEHARLKIGEADAVLQYAESNGMKVRAATVIQTGNTPDWFFNEDWADSKNARKTERETMISRMENAIRDQIELFNEKYPALVAEWEIISTAEGETDLYQETIGEDYPAFAFQTARETAAKDQKLLWATDVLPDEEMLSEAKKLREQGILDGIVLKCSMTTAESDLQGLEKTINRLAEEGLEIHLSGLGIANTDRSASGQIRLAIAYKRVFTMAEKHGVKSVSLAELQDAPGQDRKTPPRLINEKGSYTPAYFGALQDSAIPTEDSWEAVRAAVEQTGLEEIIKKEEAPVITYKAVTEHNPVMVQRFGADPWAMAYQDRVYIYMTGDDPATEKGEKPKTNDYGNIVTLRVISSDDLVNWVDHGSVRAAGRSGAAQWATNSWAPCAAWKTINGQAKFFLYFANSGGGIGVLTADSPTGPFTDPLGKPLISRATPTCAEVTWLFDPAILIDDDGTAYLYFGGGIPDGKSADPGTARVVRLNDDMISLNGDPAAIRPPWLFEDSGINKFGDTYVYSYCSNFNVPASGSKEGFNSGEIVYMTAERPMGPFTYGGRVLRNPSSYFGVGGNNHHCMFSFRGQWYITYHAATLDKAMGWSAGYRSTFVDQLELNREGLPALSKGTVAGVGQLQAFIPFHAVSGATAVSMAGVTTELAYPEDRKAGTGPMAAVSTSPDGWVAVAGVDFGNEGASSVRMRVKSETASCIEILLDNTEGMPAAILDIPESETYTEITETLTEDFTGVHDLYFRFTESGIFLLEWQFQ